MKKIISLLLALILCCSCLSMAAVAETDLFYCDPKEPSIADALEQVESELILFAKRYLEERHLPESETADESKIQFGTNKIHTTYNWNFEDVSAFLRAEDKKAFLKTLKVDFYTMPVYYDGVELENYVASFRFSQEWGLYRSANYNNTLSGDYWRTNYVDIEKVEQALINSGVTGHQVVQTVKTQRNPFYFVMTEKDNQYFAVYMYPTDEIPGGYAWHNYALAAEPELVTKRILTADEVDRVLATHEDYLKTIPENADELLAGAGQTDLSNNQQNTNKVIQEADQHDLSDNQPPQNILIWIILGSVLLIGGVLTVILVKKRR